MGLGLSVGVGFGSWGFEGVPAHRVDGHVVLTLTLSLTLTLAKAHRVDGHVVALVGLEVGRVVRLGALVDAPLLGAHEEEVLGQPREVEAAAWSRVRGGVGVRVLVSVGGRLGLGLRLGLLSGLGLGLGLGFG